MGESRRRKKILGSEYGKPKRNSQAAISSLDQTNQKIKRTEASRLPIPELEYLKLKLDSVELRDWVINEWNSLLNFAILVSFEDACYIASELLGILSREFQKNLDSDVTIKYDLSPMIQIWVRIDAAYWTIWTCIDDRSTGFKYITPDTDEFRLLSPSSQSG